MYFFNFWKESRQVDNSYLVEERPEKERKETLTFPPYFGLSISILSESHVEIHIDVIL